MLEADHDAGTGVRVTYGYDALDRLTRERRDAGDDGAFGQPDDYLLTWTWGLAGNRLTQQRETDGDAAPEETIAYDYDDPSTPAVGKDPNDRLFGETRVDHENGGATTTTTYAYGGRNPGSLTTETTDGVVTRTYSHDLRGRLVSADADGPAGPTTYAYGSHGRRVGETTDGQTTYLLVDDNSPTGYSQVLQEGGVQGGGPSVTYVQGHAVLAQADGQGNLKYEQ